MHPGEGQAWARLRLCGVSAAIFIAMHNTPHNSRRRWDGSRAAARPRRPLSLTAGAGTRLLRSGQTGCCRDCGNPVEWYYRPDRRPVSLHPRELPAAAVPEASRWHVSSGIAYAAGDGSAWCRLPHGALCPARTQTTAQPQLAGLRRRMAAHTRHLIDSRSFRPHAATGDDHGSCRPARQVVQILGICYLATRPLEDIRCLTRASTTRARCTRRLPDLSHPPGIRQLLPATTTGQLCLPADLVMAVFDRSALPNSEQLRWRAQRCPRHTAAAAEMAATDWEPFDPLVHREHIHSRLPGQTRPAHPARAPRT